MQVVKTACLATTLTLLAACGPSGTNGSGHDHDHESLALETDLYWELDEAASRLGFASVKVGEIIEVHSFGELVGVVTPEGEASIGITLDGVETGIDIRNERMREMLFETDQYPTATIEAAIDAETYARLNVGERLQSEIEGTLSLHGVEAPVFAIVSVTRIGPHQIEVASAEPVILNVEDYNLSAGLDALREIANLPAITQSSPVTFSFVFTAQEAG